MPIPWPLLRDDVFARKFAARVVCFDARTTCDTKCPTLCSVFVGNPWHLLVAMRSMTSSLNFASRSTLSLFAATQASCAAYVNTKTLSHN